MTGAALSLALAYSPGAAEGPSGGDLARRLGCFACHSRQGQGGGEAGTRASALDGIGARLSPEELKDALSHPRRRHPGAKMPSYDYLPPEEKQVLLDYLQVLK